MKHMLRWRRIIAALALIVSMTAVAYAQNEGRFTGAVLDPSGAVVAGATVSVKNERTGVVKTVTTDAGGRYVVTGLLPSMYTISVKAGNFAPLEYTNMQLVATQEFVIDLNLQAAGVGHRGALGAGTFVFHDDGRARHDRARWIEHGARKAAITLRVRG